MKITEEQIEKQEIAPGSGQKRKKKDIVVQHRADPDTLSGTDKFGSLFMRLHENWRTIGKYEKIDDAVKMLKSIDRADHIYFDFHYRVLIKKKQILKDYVRAHELAEQLENYERNNGKLLYNV